MNYMQRWQIHAKINAIMFEGLVMQSPSQFIHYNSSRNWNYKSLSLRKCDSISLYLNNNYKYNCCSHFHRNVVITGWQNVCVNLIKNRGKKKNHPIKNRETKNHIREGKRIENLLLMFHMTFICKNYSTNVLWKYRSWKIIGTGNYFLYIVMSVS